jgi:hypothetical protein
MCISFAQNIVSFFKRPQHGGMSVRHGSDAPTDIILRRRAPRVRSAVRYRPPRALLSIGIDEKSRSWTQTARERSAPYRYGRAHRRPPSPLDRGPEGDDPLPARILLPAPSELEFSHSLGHQRTRRCRNPTSVVTPRPDIADRAGHVGFVP